MFIDVDLAKTVMQTYKQSEQKKKIEMKYSDLDVDIMVLTTSFWPTYPVLEMRLPPEITYHMVRIFLFKKILIN